MFRAGLILLRRLIFAVSLLILLICGAEVGVRTYEAATGDAVCRSKSTVSNDPSKLAVPSWTFYQELKPLAVAKVACRDSNNDVEIRTNSLGLRGEEPVIPKPPEICRVVVLGDETIFAPETTESDHFCNQLRHCLQEQTRIRIEVINAGIPGHCPLSEFVLYKQRLMNLQPDLVVLHFDWSDVSDDRQLRRRARCDQSGIPQSCPHETLVASKKLQKCDLWRQQFRLLDWGLGSISSEWKEQLTRQKSASREIDTNPYAWLRDEHPDQNPVFRQAVKPIANLAQLCRSSHCPFVLMTSPKPWQVSAKCSRGPGVRMAAGVAREAFFPNRAPFEILAGYADRQKIPFVDGSTTLANGPDAESNFLRHAPRWSPKGHHEMAKLVAGFVIENISGAWNSPYFQQTEQPITSHPSNASPIQWTSGERTPTDRFDSQNADQTRR